MNPQDAMLQLFLGDNPNAQAILSLIQAQKNKANQSDVEYAPVNKILIPEGMSKLEASNELKRQHLDDNSIIDVGRDFSDWMTGDVLVAVKKAAERQFGYIHGKATFSFFSGRQLPTEMEVKTDVKNGKDVTTTCFYGRMIVSAWEDAELDVDGTYIKASLKKKFKMNMVEFLNEIEDILRKESIYRGKAVSVTIDKETEELQFNIFEVKVNPNIMLNEDARAIIDADIIPETTSMRKSTCMFFGPYGNGKTETAMNIGEYAREKGLIFFYCKESAAFEQLLETAVFYQPALVFLEDLDEIGSGAERHTRMNTILNTLDGVATKGKNIKVIFTTNHEDKINPALLRPGRLDIIVAFENPTPTTAAAILESFWKDRMDGEFDLVELAKEIGDVSGSVIAEIARRGLRRLVDGRTHITRDIARSTILSMRNHIRLMEASKVKKPNILPDMTFKLRGGVPSMTAEVSHLEEVNE